VFVLAFSLAIYVVITFAFAFVWNLQLFPRTYAAIAPVAAREDPVMATGILAIVLQGVGMTTAFAIFYEGGAPFVEGPMIALLFGVFTTTYAALVVPAKFKTDPILKFAGLELAHGVLHFATIGFVMGGIFEFLA
jgi:hypothetical protein